MLPVSQTLMLVPSVKVSIKACKGKILLVEKSLL